MLNLHGKRALITGASGDIGGAIARLLHRQGASVFVSGRKEDKLAELVGTLKERAFYATANLADRATIAELVQKAQKQMGGIDILVNNAGKTRDSLAMRMSDEMWDDVLLVNLGVCFSLTRSCLRGMMKERWGRIINITSVVGSIGNAGQANYAASKSGLAGMTRSLAQEVASRQITVNCVAPGFIQTQMTDSLTDEQKEKMMSAIPLSRFGVSEDVASCVLFLASQEASYVTGQTLHVNGGMFMT